MAWEEITFHHHQEEPYYKYLNDEDTAFLTPKRKLNYFGGSQIKGGEAENAFQTCQNEPKQEAMQAIHHDVLTARNLNSETCCLYEKKGKATSVSMTPMTPIERKRQIDRNYRKRKRDKEITLEEENKRLSRENKTLIDQLTCRTDRPKSSLAQSKAKFELNFHDDESKKEAMKLLVDLPDMDDIHLKVKKRILKLKGSFDTEAVLHMLNTVCGAHLVSKVKVPSMRPLNLR